MLKFCKKVLLYYYNKTIWEDFTSGRYRPKYLCLLRCFDISVYNAPCDIRGLVLPAVMKIPPPEIFGGFVFLQRTPQNIKEDLL